MNCIFICNSNYCYMGEHKHACQVFPRVPLTASRRHFRHLNEITMPVKPPEVFGGTPGLTWWQRLYDEFWCPDQLSFSVSNCARDLPHKLANLVSLGRKLWFEPKISYSVRVWTFWRSCAIWTARERPRIMLGKLERFILQFK